MNQLSIQQKGPKQPLDALPLPSKISSCAWSRGFSFERHGGNNAEPVSFYSSFPVMLIILSRMMRLVNGFPAERIGMGQDISVKRSRVFHEWFSM